MKPLLVTSGEPAGIGPDICLSLAAVKEPLVVMADKAVLNHRADQLGINVQCIDYTPGQPISTKDDELMVWSLPTHAKVMPGRLNGDNAPYVMDMLEKAVSRCLEDEFSGIVTGPVHKGIINEAGIPFSGHTEFLANQCNTETVVMMLACQAIRVALVTTHVPLKTVAELITQDRINQVITILDKALKVDFGIDAPQIAVAGLNPHAGEGGHLGDEEINTIEPAIKKLRSRGFDVSGPYSADTMFVSKCNQDSDAFVAMYHDQGLPVLKYASFGTAVNITLGLPIIRTSVDHGTALSLAATGQAKPQSLLNAVNQAIAMVKARETYYENH